MPEPWPHLPSCRFPFPRNALAKKVQGPLPCFIPIASSCPAFGPGKRMSEAGGSAASLAGPAAPGGGRERPLALHPGIPAACPCPRPEPPAPCGRIAFVPGAAFGMHGHCRPRAGGCCCMRAARRLPLPPRAQPSPAHPNPAHPSPAQPSRVSALRHRGRDAPSVGCPRPGGRLPR